MRWIVFGLVMAVLVGGLHLYVYRRLVRDLTERRALRRLGAVALAVLATLAVSARFVARSLSGGEPSAINLVAFLWFGFALYLALALGAGDLGRWLFGFVFPRARSLGAGAAGDPVDPARRKVVALGLGAGSVVVAGGISGFGTWRAFAPPDVITVPIRLRGLPKALDGFTVVQLSDLHVGMVIRRRFVDELVRRTNALRPDLVVITGDLVDGEVPELGPEVASISRFSARHGTYFCTGNHDHYSGADAWCAAIASLGVRPLRNQRVEIGEAGASFDLLGVDDWGGARPGLKTTYHLAGAVAGRDRSRASILLAHQPQDVDAVAHEGIGLQLSGHTHGGQLFPATAMASLMWGSLTAGLSRVGDTFVYVSRGCGFVGPAMRVGAPPELIRVVLQPA